MPARTRAAYLLAILTLSAAMRLHNLSQPMADSLQAKQVYVANRARSIAQPPFNPLRSSLDFLDANGRRMELTEEFPAYTTLLALGYRIAGEQEWVGHLLSLAGTLVALGAFFALARREWNDRSALIATTILSAAPIFLFYGRAVLPDPWMLAMMLIAAASYRRYLDEGASRWLAAASLAALSAGLFKYFGLMIFVPLAEMAWRKHGTWRGMFSRSFLTLSLTATLPMAAWLGLVFFSGANPVQSGWIDGQVMPYFVFQSPLVLMGRTFYASFFSRFLVRDCGAVALALMVIGVTATVRRMRGKLQEDHEAAGMLKGWTVMALVYYVLLAPKLLDHDYYELMMLPAAALWATRGLNTIVGMRSPTPTTTRDLSPWERKSATPTGEGVGATDDVRSRQHPHPPLRGTFSQGEKAVRDCSSSVAPARLAAVLTILVIAQSPWFMGSLFRQDNGKIALANRLKALCPPNARIVAIGPGIEFPTVIHYSHREGWPVHSRTLPGDWRTILAKYREAGASLVAVYFEPKVTAAQRESYAPLLREFPIAERQTGLRTRSGTGAEFVILDLKEPKAAQAASADLGTTAACSTVR